MTKLFLFLLFIGGSIALNAGNPDHTITFKVQPDQSVIEWVGHKVTGTHNGTIGIKDGSLVWNHGKLESGSITIDMASVTVLDQQGGGKTKLEGHLKSDDFFGVEKHPTATLTITKVTSKSEGQYSITADLTIKGITNPVTFDATIKTEANQLTATADFKVDRTLYDIRYGSGKYFTDIGDKAIYDEFDLKIKLVASGK